MINITLNILIGLVVLAGLLGGVCLMIYIVVSHTEVIVILSTLLIAHMIGEGLSE